MNSLVFLSAALTASAPSQALEQGLAGAFRGCEEWVLNPASWVDGPAKYLEAVGLGETMGPVSSVPDAALPPPAMRMANHYWRINSTPDAGYFLVVSDILPICHITGGGTSDLKPAVEAVITGADFATRWEKIDQTAREDMISTHFRHRTFRNLTMVVSRAKDAGQRQDRVQVLATASFALSN